MGMKEKYESLPLIELRKVAKARGMHKISTLKKSELVARMLEEDEKLSKENEKNKQPAQESSAKEAAARQSEPRTNTARTNTMQKNGKSRPSLQEHALREKLRPKQGMREQTPRENASREAASREQTPRENVSREAASRGQTPRENTVVRETASRDHIVRENVQQEQTNQTLREELSQGYAPKESIVSEQTSYEEMQNLEKELQTADSMEEAARPLRPDYREGHTKASPRADLDSGMEATGILEVMPDGFGFIRSANFLPGENDIYVAPSQIRRFQLRTGDLVCGNTRVKSPTEKFSALLYVKSVNGASPEDCYRRPKFEDATPIFPDRCLHLSDGTNNMAMRIVDLISPVGKGQRGMIVSPPKAGKTTLLKEVARSITRNNPEIYLMILLIDERPEEVTDIKESIEGPNVEVVYSTFDELPDRHKRVSEMVLERAKRLVEQKKDVVILLDSITRLARAYNLTVPPSGRTLSGGLDPVALHMPKRFFGAARNIREGGSLTILATALVDTGSKMDDVVYEEFKGTGNMELVLDRKLSERRVFPAVDIVKSSTRREDLLLSREEQEAVYIMRKSLHGLKTEEAVEQILDLFVKTKNNRELVHRVRKMKFI